MVFIPIWENLPPSREPAVDFDVDSVVTTAAEGLVTALEAAHQLTNAWQDHELGYALIEQALSDCLLQLATTELWGRDNQVPSSRLWQIAGDYLKLGWLQNRAHEKPLGYAGDYQLLDAIIERRLSADPLGRLFDLYFQSQAAPEAVRSRTQHVAHAFAAHRIDRPARAYSTVSVGAGAGVDIREGLACLPPSLLSDMQVTLLDLDDSSLNFAASRVGEILPSTQVRSARENLFRLGRKPKSADLIGVPDFLVCSGLFDYLDDNVAVDLLRLFWRRLAKDGLMLVGNFVPFHATRAYMEWIGNWYLIYRTVPEMRQLAAAAGIPPENFFIGADRTGTDLFLTAKKS